MIAWWTGVEKKLRIGIGSIVNVIRADRSITEQVNEGIQASTSIVIGFVILAIIFGVGLLILSSLNGTGGVVIPNILDALNGPLGSAASIAGVVIVVIFASIIMAVLMLLFGFGRGGRGGGGGI